MGEAEQRKVYRQDNHALLDHHDGFGYKEVEAFIESQEKKGINVGETVVKVSTHMTEITPEEAKALKQQVNIWFESSSTFGPVYAGNGIMHKLFNAANIFLEKFDEVAGNLQDKLSDRVDNRGGW